MEILKYIAVYAAGFATILILDYIWLGTVTKDFIIREFGNLITVGEDGKININLVAGLTAWLSIAIMVVTFVTLRFTGYKDIILYGALMGCMMYAMYDLTNLTFLNGYSLTFTLVDIAWGTFACTLIAVNSYYVLTLFK